MPGSCKTYEWNCGSEIICRGGVVQEMCHGRCYSCAAPKSSPPEYNPPACATNSTYDLNTYVKDAIDGCDSLGAGEPGALVTIYKDNGGNLGSEIYSGTTDGSGKVFLDNTSTSNSTLYFQVSKTTDEAVYELICPTPSVYKVNLNPSACDTKTVNLGVVAIEAEAWKTVIDGDIFAGGIGIEVPDREPLGDFSAFLVNSDGGAGGFVLAKGMMTTDSEKITETEDGGYAQQLNEGGLSHNDIALYGFTFLPPDHEEVDEISSIDSFTDGSVYKISVDDFNSSLESGDVSYGLDSGFAVLYITGSDDVVFENSLISSGSGRLIIVTDSDVMISKNVGFEGATGYEIGATPNIQASIIASKDITFETEDTDPGTDDPVMVLGPLVSKQTINLSRDLGVLNASYPAISVKHDQTLMCELSELEKSKTDFINYTGLRTFDIQFDYGN